MCTNGILDYLLMAQFLEVYSCDIRHLILFAAFKVNSNQVDLMNTKGHDGKYFFILSHSAEVLLPSGFFKKYNHIPLAYVFTPKSNRIPTDRDAFKR